MEDGFSVLTLNKVHGIICGFLNCDTGSVRGQDLLEYLKDNMVAMCPFCGSDVDFKYYTDGRTGFLCDSCGGVGQYGR